MNVSSIRCGENSTPVEELERLLLANAAPRLCHLHSALERAAERAVVHKRPRVEVEEEKFGGGRCAWRHVLKCQCVGVCCGNFWGAAGRLVEVLGEGDELGDAARGGNKRC